MNNYLNLKYPAKLLVAATFLVVLMVGASLFIYVDQPRLTQASGKVEFVAKPHKDLVQFKAEGGGVKELQVEIYNLSGRRIYKKKVSGRVLNWNRTRNSGERLKRGAYLYAIKAKDSQGNLHRSGIGKIFLSPDQIHLTQGPSSPGTDREGGSLKEGTTAPENKSLEPENKSLEPEKNISEDLTVEGSISSVETGNSGNKLRVESGPEGRRAGFEFKGHGAPNPGDFAVFTMRNDFGDMVLSVKDTSADTWNEAFQFEYLKKLFDFRSNQVVNVDKLGVGTNSPNATVEIHGSDQNLLALYDPIESTADPKFKVQKDGTVRADGTYYGSSFETGGADVAERINVSEWMKKGHVVEIDPKHPGFFRKTRSAYSTKVAGVISTAPGVTLGNSESQASSQQQGNEDKWRDQRPALALAGRVPTKVTAQNGSIEVGDLLVSFSKPGYAMKCSDPTRAVGTTIGKALEPLEEGTGTIMVQISLG